MKKEFQSASLKEFDATNSSGEDVIVDIKLTKGNRYMTVDVFKSGTTTVCFDAFEDAEVEAWFVYADEQKLWVTEENK